jgi:hypothetical protein
MKPLTTAPRWPTWRKRLIAATVLAAVVMIGLDVLAPDVQHWFRDHPIVSGFISGVLVLALAALIIEGELERREAARWDPIARRILEELATSAGGAMDAIRQGSKELEAVAGSGDSVQCQKALDGTVRRLQDARSAAAAVNDRHLAVSLQRNDLAVAIVDHQTFFHQLDPLCHRLQRGSANEGAGLLQRYGDTLAKAVDSLRRRGRDLRTRPVLRSAAEVLKSPEELPRWMRADLEKIQADYEKSRAAAEQLSGDGEGARQA